MKINDKEKIYNYIDTNKYFPKNNRKFCKSKTELKDISSKNNLNSKIYKSILNSTNFDLKKNNYKLLNDFNSSYKENDKKIKVTFKDEAGNCNTKCKKIIKQYKSTFIKLPESFPGITLLNSGLPKRKLHLKKIKISNKISPNKNEKNNDNKRLTYKEIVINNIKQTVKDNILRNARRIVYPIYPSYS